MSMGTLHTQTCITNTPTFTNSLNHGNQPVLMPLCSVGHDRGSYAKQCH